MKTLSLLPCLSLALLLLSCHQQNKESNDQLTEDSATVAKPTTPVLTKAWETDTLLITSESVLYYEKDNLLFVSCVNGTPLEKDGNGYIAQVGLDGTIINEKWAKDMDAPKGMGVYGDNLYVTNITELVEIDIATGSITNRWQIEGSGFLNDITVDTNGTVYFTDSKTNKIHALKDGQVSTWLEGSDVTGFNGLLAEDKGLMMASMGSSNFVQIDWETKSISVKTDSIGAGDGVVSDGVGNYIVSSWAGEVFLINGNTWEKTRLLSTQAQEIQSADITYIPEKKLLLVPTFFTNTVAAYRLENQ